MTPNQEVFQNLKEYMNSQIIGQPDLIDRLLIALLSDGHLLVEGDFVSYAVHITLGDAHNYPFTHILMLFILRGL